MAGGRDAGEERGRGEAVRYLVAGASGYVGQAVQAALLHAGHRVVAVSRRGDACPGAEPIAQDLLATDLKPLLLGVDGVVNLVGVLRERPFAGTTFERTHLGVARRLTESAAAVGVRRFVHLSSLAASRGARGRYFDSKRAAEKAVAQTLPGATVVRASLVFGPGSPLQKGLDRLAALPVAPVPGLPHTLFDPVHRDDLAVLLASIVADGSDAVPLSLEVGGPRRVTLAEMVDWAAAARGRRIPVPKWCVPLPLLSLLAAAGSRWPTLSISSVPLEMLTTPNTTDDDRWRQWVPHPASPF